MLSLKNILKNYLLCAHIKSFSLCINKWCSGVAHNHQDIKMKLFALSLEEDASNWFSSLDDNKYATITDLIDRFIEIWEDNKEHRHLLAVLHSIKKNENETMEEFNKKFNELVTSIHTDYKPPTTSILIYYIEAFNWEMRYQLQDKEPTNLKASQEMAIKIDKNMQASQKSNLPGFSRGNTSKQSENKEKEVVLDNKDTSHDPLKALT